MRRLLVVALMVVSLVAAAAAYGFRDTTRPGKWVLMDVSKDHHGLRLSYVGGGCVGEATARVTETAADVSIELDQAESVPEGDNEACTSDLRFYTLVVRLRAPLNGRRVRGQARGSAAEEAAIGPFRFRHGDAIPLVPRLLGLAPPDARRLLRLHGFRVRLTPASACGTRARVVAQWPRPHAVRRPRNVLVAVRTGCP